MKEAIEALSWENLCKFSSPEADLINGPNNSYTSIRLFGQEKNDIRVTLFRDNHAWCPYCQKVWLWLEWKKIPYQIQKATMRCYGKKESWYLKKVPSGMFPAIELDKKVITESDKIILSLEKEFGPLGLPMNHPNVINLRNLERQLFRAWCIWLCTPSINKNQSTKKRENFQQIAKELDTYLAKTNLSLIDPSASTIKTCIPGSADIIFIPYLERMNASLAYYKGVRLRKEYSNIDKWFQALEKLDTYRGTQGDFHTHAHDLPPQMGGCWTDSSSKQEYLSSEIDSGNGLDKDETTFVSSQRDKPSITALDRVLKHRERIKQANPLNNQFFDQPLRAALTAMIYKQPCKPKPGSALGLRYLRDRISVPRDMSLLAAREFRKSLEQTASLDSNEQGPAIPTKNRFDQNPIDFSNI